MTRAELGNVLSAQTPSRTLHNSYATQAQGKEISDDWVVTFVEVDKCGVLVIYCDEPTGGTQ